MRRLPAQFTILDSTTANWKTKTGSAMADQKCLPLAWRKWTRPNIVANHQVTCTIFQITGNVTISRMGCPTTWVKILSARVPIINGLRAHFLKVLQFLNRSVAQQIPNSASWEVMSDRLQPHMRTQMRSWGSTSCASPDKLQLEMALVRSILRSIRVSTANSLRKDFCEHRANQTK